MKSVGKILKELREEKFYSMEDVEKATKIRKELIEALEKDDYEKLPPEIFVQGFIKNYGKFLKADVEKLLAIFRRDFASKKHPPVILESLKKPFGQKKFFNITPGRLIGLTVFLIVLGFFAYLWVEYRQFVGAPKLEVTSPQDQQSVEIPAVSVEGQTAPEIKVTVNDQEVGVDNSGHFQEEIKLSSSVNKITITATSRFGQAAKIERTVFVKK